MLDALCRALDRYQWAYDGIAGTLMDLRYSNGLLSQNHAEKEVKLTAELTESRKQHLVATQRNVELTGELNAANAALQQYVTSYQTYVGRIKEVDRTLAQMENQRAGRGREELPTVTIFLAIP